MFKNKKVLLGFILGVFVTSIISVGAVSLIYSKDVTYDNSTSGLKSTTVQGALDELYESAKNAPTCNSEGECTVTCPSGQVFSATSNGYKCSEKTLSDVVTLDDYYNVDSFIYVETTLLDNDIQLRITRYCNTTDTTNISNETTIDKYQILDKGQSKLTNSECGWARKVAGKYCFLSLSDESGKYKGVVNSNTKYYTVNSNMPCKN